MRLTVRNIPDDPAAWPEWLERQLVDVRLTELVAELAVLQEPADAELPVLAEVCGGNLAAVHEQGLTALNTEQIRQLLQHPELLLILQESVFVHGGDYWSHVPRPTESAARTRESWERVAVACEIGPTLDNAAENDDGRNQRVATARPDRSGPASRRSVWLVGLSATVAVLLVGLGLWFRQPASPTWGFERGGLLTADVSGAEHLNSLADAAGDWFNKRPQDAHGVLRRLREFEEGCDTLISAPHPQLTDADRQWLVERCAVWKGKLVAQAAELDAGRVSPLAARETADEIVRTLQRSLRERAATLAS